MGVVLALGLLFSPADAAAQALCPAGTRPAGTRCVKDGASAWAAPGVPETEPPPAPPAKAREPAADPDAVCGAFNGRLAAFHQRYAAAYADEGRRHKELEESLRREADQDRRLAVSLRRQAFMARQADLRFQLRDQARAAGEAADGAEARLASAMRTDREEEERFKDLYKVEAETLLEGRPKGCAVKTPR